MLRAADVIVVGTDVDVVDPALAERERRAETSVVTISAFGADGPLAGAPADEFTLQAWCGLMSGCGTRDTPPLQMGIGHGHWATGAMTALGRWRANEHLPVADRRRSVEVSALEVMTVCLSNYPTLYRHFTGSVSVMSRGGDWPQIVRCKDGWIGLCIFTPQQWDDFANMIGRPELAGDDRFNSMGGRGRNRELAQSVIRPWLEQHTAEEIYELGGLFRVPVALRRQRARRARHGPLPSSAACSSRTRRVPPAPVAVSRRAPRRRARCPMRMTPRSPPGGARPSGRSTACACSTSPRSGPAPPPRTCSPRSAPTW